MLRNYLLVALRNLRKYKLYAAINVVGLALGLAFCTLIFLYVRDEMTYDRFHERADRIHRVYRASYNPDGSSEQNDPWLPMPLGPAMKADLPEVEDYVRLSQNERFVRTEGEALEENILFADPSFFRVFSFSLRNGDPEAALADPGSVVLSEAAAKKYFGDQDPVGRPLSIRLDDAYLDFTVTAVADDPPTNSSIPFEIVVPYANVGQTSWGRRAVDNWGMSGYMTFVLLDENASAAELRKKLGPFRKKYYPDEAEGSTSPDGSPQPNYELQALTDMHLSRDVTSGIVMASNPLYSYILGGIALIVLLIACINFTTLAVGRSAARAREIGVRKVVGANKMQLMSQFWGEALLLSTLAAVVGLVLSGLFLPVFNDLSGKDLHLDYASNAGTLLVLAGMVIATGMLAGSYPALILSGVRPVETLKNRFRIGGSRPFTRSLVVLQFALSVFLIVSTLVMVDQLRFVQSKELGFDKENVVVISTEGLDGRRALGLFRNELAGRSDIAGVTGVSASFAQGYSRWGFRYKGELKNVFVYGVEADFLDVLGIEVVEGRSFDPLRSTDSTGAVIINAAMARYFDWNTPVGEIVSGLVDDDPAADPVVIGVTEEFNFRSLHSPIEPAMLTLGLEGFIGNILVRIRPGDVEGTVAALKATWEKVTPEVPFTYTFMDEDLEQQYLSDQRWSKIVSYASFFAILVACLGLFGLASLAVAGRTKEIGIRKVLGASVTSVARLISREFIWLVGAGLLLAAPAAYYAMSRWLEGFAYHIEIGPGIFLLSGVVVLVTAMLAVSYQAVKAAVADPVRSLRYE